MNKLKIFLGLGFLCTSLYGHAQLRVETLRVDAAQTPKSNISFVEVTDNHTPRFSWQLRDEKLRNVVQASYGIVVTDEHNDTVWQSGQKHTAQAMNIVYAGKPLKPTTSYYWTVTVTDNKGRVAQGSSRFETGLMSTTDTDVRWKGARWIGGKDDARSFESQYLPVFRLNATLTLDASTHTTRAGFIYGANDWRLMDASKNILGVNNLVNESYIKVELDVQPLLSGDSAVIKVYRVGYTTKDVAHKPLAIWKIPTNLINRENCYEEHQIEAASMYGITQIFIDGSDKALGEINLNPMGKGGDYIAFPVVADLGFSVPKGMKATLNHLAVHNYRAPGRVISSLPKAITLQGTTRFYTPKATGVPYLRTAFNAPAKEVAKARVYITARGVYDLYLNGKRINHSYLNPGLTQYNKTQMYQTFDVTPYVRVGNNAMGIVLSEGWWSGAITFQGQSWNFFGDKQAAMALLAITYTDGTTTTVATNPQEWKYTTEGPIRLSSIFQGEIYDARKDAALEGWTLPDYDDEKWQRVEEVKLADIVSRETRDIGSLFPQPEDYSQYRLIAQIGSLVHPFTRIQAQSVRQVRPGVYVYDMGQNMAGVPRIAFRNLPKGSKVMMRFAEVTYPDLPEYKDYVGMVMMENQRGAMEQDIYIAKGGSFEQFSPRFTYHGYRYVEITGIDHPLALNDVEGIVLSSVDALTASYRTDNETLNRFFKNVQWSTLANAFSVPTDCPQRNERMGWSGDLSVFCPAMSYVMDVESFFERHLLAL